MLRWPNLSDLLVQGRLVVLDPDDQLVLDPDDQRDVGCCRDREMFF